MIDESTNWKSVLDRLIEDESTLEWKPFPDHNVDFQKERKISIPQISTKRLNVQIIAKITDDFQINTNYTNDEETIPPKVFCWSDVSALDLRVASKTVKAGLEREYKSHIKDFTISFQTYKSKELCLDFSENPPDLVIYHVLDPTITQRQTVSTRTSRIVSSYSNNSIAKLHSKTLPKVQSSEMLGGVDSIRKAFELVSGPSIFILDCSYAGKIMRQIAESGNDDVIVFAATNETLPYAPKLPCDLFTSCMLTPANVAILMQTQNFDDINCGILKSIDILDFIPMVDTSDKKVKSILRTLNSALEVYVDQIAYQCLEYNLPLFYKLFRRDHIRAKFFYYFIFACRMMKNASTTPISYPALPDMSQHPLWDAFDLQVDRALASLRPNPLKVFTIDSFLEENIKRLETWLWFPNPNRPIPNELSTLPLLIGSQKYFERALRFSAKFLNIQSKNAATFLSTNAFPFVMKAIGKFIDLSSDVIADIAFVIAISISNSPDLIQEFRGNFDFLIKPVYSNDNEQLLVSALCCILQFHSYTGLTERFKELSNNKSSRVRTLANLILSQMQIGLDLPIKKLSDEKYPFCRASTVTRITATLDSLDLNDQHRNELYFDIALCLNDPFFYVREEALVSLSHALNKESSEFLNALYNYLLDWNDTRAANPIINLIGHHMKVLIYEPSIRIARKFIDFMTFFDLKLSGKEIKPLSSHLSEVCLSKLIKLENTFDQDNVVSTVVTQPLIAQPNIKFDGKPSISPSGLLAIGDTDGQLICQTNKNPFMYNFFSGNTNVAYKIPTRFKEFFDKKKARVAYTAHIDDNKVLSVSTRSQVVIADTRFHEDAVCSFFVSQPDLCENMFADFNGTTYNLLATTGTATISIYKLETLQKTIETRIERSQASCIGWMKPFSSLYYVAQNNFMIFDMRSQQLATSFLNTGSPIIGANSSYAMPFYMMLAKQSGNISMIDMRTMTEITSKVVGKSIKSFDVHKHLPFGLGIIDNSVYSIAFDNGINPCIQDFGSTVLDFTLSTTESTCAIRTASKVSLVDVIVNI